MSEMKFEMLPSDLRSHIFKVRSESMMLDFEKKEYSKTAFK